ncbi:family 16 glycoside hydrolase [Fibrella arboris]|uniref:family 16 glycoside hydrolase n=1 Tax=Fibrella arboris TaxID=3242486 RepID=UPI00351FCE76
MRIASTLALSLGSCLLSSLATAQLATKLPLNDLSAFRQPVAANWKVVSDVTATLSQANSLQVKPAQTGTPASVLVCLPTGQTGSQTSLQTTLEHGDADLEFDFMLAKGANSGVYLQGRYEIQLADSWGLTVPKSSDIGAIYERWDASRGTGQEGYEGHPARQNAGRAPGLWQHLTISFQAPRFDAAGKKTENAKIIRAELNGVLIHDNVELTGPTRGAVSNNEVARGPVVIQGDHGAVAFKNMTYTLFDRKKPRLTDLAYKLYKGQYRDEASFGGAAPESKGTSPVLSASVSPIPNNFALRYTGTLHVEDPGEYTFAMNTAGGGGQLRINNQPLSKWSDNRHSGNITLPAGDLPFEAIYTKYEEWSRPDLQLAVSGPGIRQFTLTPASLNEQGDSDPILVTAENNTILRSFMDLPRSKNAQGRSYRVTHGISVGSPEQVHYTYDADFGTIVQAWHGLFLDATPMWESRGDGSSRPMGVVTYLSGKPQLFLARLASADAPWPTDTTGSGFRPKGYQLDDKDRPTFRYQTAATAVEDQIQVLPDGHGLRRQLTMTQPGSGLYARLASGTSVEPMPNNTYLIDGKTYMIDVSEAGGKQPIVRTSHGLQELIIPVSGKLTYSILF